MKTIENLLKQGRHFLAAVFFFIFIADVVASPQSDLSSQSQEVRDAAAKILQATYVMPQRTNWDSLVSKLKLGTQKTKILEILGQFTNNIVGGGGSGATEMERYRLDDLWMLECSYTGSGSNRVLTNIDFVQGLRSVDIEPPTGYTGEWRTYYVNGQKSGEGYYKDGRRNRDGIGFYPDGSKQAVLHWVNGVADGENICFFPSGRIKYKGNYKAGVQVGTWIWYKEDGSVETKQDFSKTK